MISTPVASRRVGNPGSRKVGLISTTTVIRRIGVTLGLSASLMGTFVLSTRESAPDKPVAQAARTLPAVAAVAPAAEALPVPPPPPVAPPENKFLRPIDGQLLSGYGVRSDGMHTGIDLRGATGDPIQASRKGSVTTQACGSGYGTCTIIDHGGGMSTLYAHMSVKTVAAGPVERGQVIGLVGCTGSCDSPHVHFEIRINGVRIDPLAYL